MVEIVKSDIFDAWLRGLKDAVAKARIVTRIDRLAAGNPGDCKPVGEGVSELRIDYGPGYRIDFKQQGHIVAILLIGGDKSSQARDIARAKAIARAWE